jgi:deoxyribonuclease IV
MSTVGLHLRITSTLPAVLEKATRFGLPFFQSFALYQESGTYIECTRELVKACALQRASFASLYLHGSYYINLASPYKQQLLKKEIDLAKKLCFSHIIFHPGAITDGVEREVGLERVARTLNMLLKREKDIIIVLENSAHAQKSLGGSFDELAAIRELLDYPEKVQFCIDTAHAYVFGYNVAGEHEQSVFIKEAITLFGVHALALLHINDTKELLGSRIDRHCAPGQGNIGTEALKRFVCHPLLKEIPALLELPEVSESEEYQALCQVRAWRAKEGEV